jgi:hypothetical protein
MGQIIVYQPPLPWQMPYPPGTGPAPQGTPAPARETTDPFDLSSRKTTDPWGLGGAELSDAISAFIAEHPVWLLYARRDLRFPCTACWDPMSHSPRNKQLCPNCIGLGYKVLLERHMTRFVIRGNPAGAPLLGPGYVTDYPVTVHARADECPRPQDIYVEVEWNAPIDQIGVNGRPTRVLHCYMVDMAAPMRQDTLSFFTSGCTPYDFDFDFLTGAIAGKRIERGSL